MSQTVVLKVGMSCKGCVGAVERVLSKMEGVESYDVSIEQQKVTVKGNIEPQAVFEKVSKTGKKTEFWKEELEAEKSAPAEVPAVAPPAEALNELVDTTKAVPADVATVASDAPKEAPTKIVVA